MKKFLRISTIVAVLSFLLPFTNYSTSRMAKPVYLNIIDFIFGKSLAVQGLSEKVSSGFNLMGALAVGLALLAVVAAWVIPKIKVSKYVVALLSLGSTVAFTLALSPFSAKGEFVQTVNNALDVGFKFTTTLPYAIIIAILLFNILTGLVSEKFAFNLGKFSWFYVMLFPAILFFAVFTYLPMFGLVIMFLDFKVADMFASTWKGLYWFKTIFDSIQGDFGNILLNTLIISVSRMLWGFPAPIILALLFNECGNMLFKRIIQTVSYLPHFES